MIHTPAQPSNALQEQTYIHRCTRACVQIYAHVRTRPGCLCCTSAFGFVAARKYHVDVPEVETLHAWVYTESGDQVDVDLQDTISAMWAWRAWWVLDSGGAAPAQSGPSAPSSSTGIFAPIVHRAQKAHKDCCMLGSSIRLNLERP
jgi:hypothetical protein